MDAYSFWRESVYIAAYSFWRESVYLAAYSFWRESVYLDFFLDFIYIAYSLARVFGRG